MLDTPLLPPVANPERRQKLLEEFESSGLSGAKFAALVGIKYSTFATWAAKRKRAQASAAAPAEVVGNSAEVRWLEAVVGQAQVSVGQESGALTIDFGSGARAEITNARQAELAATLLRALENWTLCCMKEARQT